mmetsp:Transcript_8262/g.23623  ORF Transcript_8262/g.23623 Transcript_8262/m.23623 type:complete len:214 (-) Transcript_8262:555-1196(-)
MPSPHSRSRATASPLITHSRKATEYSIVGRTAPRSKSTFGNSRYLEKASSASFVPPARPSVSTMVRWFASFTTARITAGESPPDDVAFSYIARTPPFQSTPWCLPWIAGIKEAKGILKDPMTTSVVIGPLHGTRESCVEQIKKTGTSLPRSGILVEGLGSTPFQGATATTALTSPGILSSKLTAALMDAPPPIECPARAIAEAFTPPTAPLAR